MCVIVHHGEYGWNAPTRLHELVEGVAKLPELQRLVPDFQILVDDLVRQPDDELQRRELPPFPKVVLWVLRDARTIQRFYSHLAAWGEELARLTQEAPEDAATIMRYIIGVVGDQSFEDIHKRIVEVVPATEKVMATAAQELIQRGKIEGKAEGKAEGILVIFETRDLAVSAEQRAKILACKDVTQLDRWLGRAVTVNTVEELFFH